MKRRTLLRTTGVGLSTTLAGCAVSQTNSGDGSEPQTQTGPKQPVPGKAKIGNIQEVTGSSITFSMYYANIPRKVKFRLTRYTPSTNDRGEWDTRTIEGAIRPQLKYNTEGEVVSESTGTYSEDGLVTYVTVDFPANSEPTGVPLTYRITLIEHTLSGQTRHLGYTPLLLKRPDTGEFMYQKPTGQVNVLRFGYNDAFYKSSVNSDGKRTNTFTSTSTASRWKTPRMEDVSNRPVTTSNYHRGRFERPWSIQYTIEDDVYDEYRYENIDDYQGHIKHPGGDMGNLIRIIEDDFADNPELARLAEIFNDKAESIGLTSPLGKLRFICDFAQWLPYRADKTLPENKPRVKVPITTLYEMEGDCEDKVALVAGLLYQDAFPDYKIGAYYIHDPAHVGVAIKRDIFDVDVDSVGDSEEYLYVEVTYPSALGLIYDGWSQPKIQSDTPPGHPDPTSV